MGHLSDAEQADSTAFWDGTYAQGDTSRSWFQPERRRQIADTLRDLTQMWTLR
jgi:hypothetical protein